MVHRKALLLLFLALFLNTGAVLALQETETPDQPARARIALLVPDAPELEIYLNGVGYVAPDGTTLYPPGIVSDFEAFPAGTYSLALSPAEAGLEGAVVGPQDLILEAGHAYTVALLGRYAEKNLRFLVIDETAAFPDVANISSRVLINNLKGAPNMDMIVDGKTIISDLAYGEAATAEQPIGGVESILFTETGEPDKVIFQGAIPRFLAGTTYFLALTGSYPGEPFTDFFPIPAVTFMGEVTTRDGGSIAPGGAAEGELADAGERVAYALDLDQAATVDIMLGAGAESPLDAYVRLYDADGKLIAENDELDFEDEFSDAGILAQKLEPGEYTIEVASWGDAFPGGYVLSVVESE